MFFIFLKGKGNYKHMYLCNPKIKLVDCKVNKFVTFYSHHIHLTLHSTDSLAMKLYYMLKEKHPLVLSKSPLPKPPLTLQNRLPEMVIKTNIITPSRNM